MRLHSPALFSPARVLPCSRVMLAASSSVLFLLRLCRVNGVAGRWAGGGHGGGPSNPRWFRTYIRYAYIRIFTGVAETGAVLPWTAVLTRRGNLAVYMIAGTFPTTGFLGAEYTDEESGDGM